MNRRVMLMLATAALLTPAGCKRAEQPSAAPPPEPQSTAIPAEPTEPTPAVAPAAALEEAECGNIPNLHRLGNVYTAGQPSPDDLGAAKDLGIRTVISIRHEAEIGDFDEAAVVEQLGMVYENPAWNGADELTDEIIDHSRELLRTAERPILFHCGSANRVGAIWLAHRVLDEGLPIEAALEEARTVGLKTAAYEEIVRNYIERH